MALARESDQGEATAESATADEGSARGRGTADAGFNVLGIAAAAIGGGIGVLSFVAFFGAAILWVRMDQAGIPANEAVAVVPKSVLVATGASFLVPSLLVALGFTVLLYLAERLTVFLSTKSLRELEQELAEAERAAEREQAIASEARQSAELALQHKHELEEAEAEPSTASGIDREEMEQASSAAGEALKKAQATDSEAQPAAREAEQDLLAARKEAQRVRDEQTSSIEWRRRALRLVLTAALFAAGAAAGILIFSVELPLARIAILLALWFALTTLCLVVRASTNFAWFALAAFVAVGLLSGCITYFRTLDDPKVEPAAVLRSHGPPVFGFFIAQTSDRVYLGTRLPTSAIRLDAIPREEVTDLAVAALETKADAYREARVLAFAICRLARERHESSGEQVKHGAGAKPASSTNEPCARSDVRRLSAGLDHSTGGGKGST